MNKFAKVLFMSGFLTIFLMGCGEQKSIEIVESTIIENIESEEKKQETVDQSLAEEGEKDEPEIDIEERKKAQEIILKYCDQIEEFEGDYVKGVRYQFIDFDADGIDELVAGRWSSHSSPLYFFKQTKEEWTYLGYFGETGSVRYIEGENLLMAAFGNQGYFREVYVSLADTGFQVVGSAISAMKANGEEVINTGFPVPDATKGLRMGSFQDFHYDEKEYACTNEEYKKYIESILQGRKLTWLSYEDLKPLFEQ